MAKHKYVALKGGLDLETPPIEARPGSALEAVNFYEDSQGGYTSLLGYRKFDGSGSPAQPPGRGDLRGVAQNRGTALVWRGADTGRYFADVLKCYKATLSGWQEVDLAYVYEVNVAGATVATPGDICNVSVGGTVYDKILGVYEYLSSGTPDPDKRVYVVKRVGTGTPTDFIREDAVDLGSRLGTVFWEPVEGSNPFSKVRYYNHNFYAGIDRYNTYFTDGINVAMFYNAEDDVIQPVSSDYRTMSDVYRHVIAFNQRLILSTEGGTFVTSVAGDPDQLDGFLGSTEIGVGDEITGFALTATDQLAIFTENQTHLLKGTSSANWQLRLASAHSGAHDGCIAQVDDVFSVDDHGISRLRLTDTIGGFQAGTVTDKITKLAPGSYSTAATTIRTLNQMRFYKQSGEFLILTRVTYNANGNEGVRYGITQGQYVADVNFVSTEVTTEGTERTLIAGDDYVYETDVGTTQDGWTTAQTLALHYNHLGSPMVTKKFRGIDVDVQQRGAANQTFKFEQTLSHGEKAYQHRNIGIKNPTQPWNPANFPALGNGEPPYSPQKLPLRGSGKDIQFKFSRTGVDLDQITINGYSVRYSERHPLGT